MHFLFEPADVRNGDALKAEMIYPALSGQALERARLWRISPMGAEFLWTGGAPPAGFAVGRRVAVRVTVAEQCWELSGRIVRTDIWQRGEALVGIRWERPAARGEPSRDRRAARRWRCGPDLVPIVQAVHPACFARTVHFRVPDVSGTGLALQVSPSDSLLVPGMRLRGVILFPTLGEVPLTFEIARAWSPPHGPLGRLALGVSIIEPSRQLTELLGQYVLQFGPLTSVEELRSGGLSVRSVVAALEFSFVRTAEEYRQVLVLRQLAYSQAGKIAADLPIEATSDAFDQRARILIARHRDRVVGSVRLMYHGAGDPTEHEQFVPLPRRFPPRQEMVEVTRVCTHPEYRRNDLLHALFVHAALAVLQSGRRWVLGSATRKLLPLYEKVGFPGTGITYRHEQLGGEEHVIMLCEISGMLSGRGVNPLLWSLLGPPVIRFIEANRLHRFRASQRVRMAAYRLVGPLARAIQRWHVQRIRQRRTGAR